MPNLCQYTESFCINIYFILQRVYNVQLVTICRHFVMPSVNWQIFYNKIKEFENILVNITVSNFFQFSPYLTPLSEEHLHLSK